MKVGLKWRRLFKVLILAQSAFWFTVQVVYSWIYVNLLFLFIYVQWNTHPQSIKSHDLYLGAVLNGC